MYEELVKQLRDQAVCADSGNEIGNSMYLNILKAADAIEELSAHYCPHMIRNVHDRGDDSMCRVLGAEPPKEEKK